MPRNPEISAGLLVFRRGAEPEYLLGHPGGPFWRRRDAASWSIPKGLAEGEADLLATAQREFREETGFSPSGPFLPLAPVRQRNGKSVHAWAAEADVDCAAFTSNAFALEWPPRSGRLQQFPELDRLAYFPYAAAREKILAYQRPLLDELHEQLAATQSPSP